MYLYVPTLFFALFIINLILFDMVNNYKNNKQIGNNNNTNNKQAAACKCKLHQK